MSPKVIIVTGASRGIGLAVSRFLLARPQRCNLVVVARSRQPLEDLQQDEVGDEDRVRVISGDLADFSLAQRAVDLAISTWGRLDGLVINHGQMDPVQRVADADLLEWKHSFDVNVFSYIAMVEPSISKDEGCC